jgi:hypothetical protein
VALEARLQVTDTNSQEARIPLWVKTGKLNASICFPLCP